MNYLTHQLLNAEEINFIKEKLGQEIEGWEDGKNTAGSHASKVKNNLQLNKKSDISKELSLLIKKKILDDNLIKSFTLPKHIHGIMFTKSLKGMSYGRHIDNAYMRSGRSDMSFTLFLSDPNDYEGGELAIQTSYSLEKIKLPKGHIVIYPSTSLHSVEEVQSGKRFVCVGWIQSYVKSSEDRNLLFGLDAGSKALLAKHGRSPELDLVFQAYGNLLRRLGN